MERHRPGPLRAVQDGLISRWGTMDPTDGGDTFRYALSSGWRGPAGGGLLQASVYAVRYQLHLFSDFTYFLDDPVHGDQFEQADDRWQVGTSGAWTGELALGSVNHALTAGWEARVDWIRPIGLYHTQARRVLEAVRQDDVVESSGGLFLQVDSPWSSWLRTVAGVRYDQYWFDVVSDLPANSGWRGAGIASPKASAILGPWATTEVFDNFGLGFHSNDARGVTMRVDPLPPHDTVAPVTPLVRTRGYEIGARPGVVPALQSSLALWALDMDSELLFTGDAGTTEPSRPSHRQGVEWSTRWTPLPWLLLDLEVCFSSARFTAPDPLDPPRGPHVPGAIESAVSAGAAIHELGRWSASAVVRYFGPRPLEENGVHRSSASTLASAQVAYRLGTHLRLELEVFNLLDARVDDIAYWYRSRTSPTAAAEDDYHFHPAASRTIRGGLAVSF